VDQGAEPVKTKWNDNKGGPEKKAKKRNRKGAGENSGAKNKSLEGNEGPLTSQTEKERLKTIGPAGTGNKTSRGIIEMNSGLAQLGGETERKRPGSGLEAQMCKWQDAGDSHETEKRSMLAEDKRGK